MGKRRDQRGGKGKMKEGKGEREMEGREEGSVVQCHTYSERQKGQCSSEKQNVKLDAS